MFDPTSLYTALFQVVGGLQISYDSDQSANSLFSLVSQGDMDVVESPYNLQGIFGDTKYLFLNHTTNPKPPPFQPEALTDLDQINDTTARVAFTPAERSLLQQLNQNAITEGDIGTFKGEVAAVINLAPLPHDDWSPGDWVNVVENRLDYRVTTNGLNWERI